MSRRCMVTGKMQMSGNNVSHAQNKTRRKFNPSVNDQGIYSEVLGKMVRLRVSPNGLRTIEHKGGLDVWLTSTAKTKLPVELQKVKTRIEKTLEAAGKAAPKKPTVAKKPTQKKKTISARLAKKVAAKKDAAPKKKAASK
jgi:large subunit ribosomal protein L28